MGNVWKVRGGVANCMSGWSELQRWRCVLHGVISGGPEKGGLEVEQMGERKGVKCVVKRTKMWRNGLSGSVSAVFSIPFISGPMCLIGSCGGVGRKKCEFGISHVVGCNGRVSGWLQTGLRENVKLWNVKLWKIHPSKIGGKYILIIYYYYILLIKHNNRTGFKGVFLWNNSHSHFTFCPAFDVALPKSNFNLPKSNFNLPESNFNLLESNSEDLFFNFKNLEPDFNSPK